MRLHWIHPRVWLTDSRCLLIAVGVGMSCTAVYCQMQGAERKSASSVPSVSQQRASSGVIAPGSHKRVERPLSTNELTAKRGDRNSPDPASKRATSEGKLKFNEVEFRELSEFGSTTPGASRRVGATKAAGARPVPKNK